MPIQNHTDVVAAVKADLERRGVDLHSSCGAFEITARVAWKLRAEGAGLMKKTTGTNCHGYKTDGVIYPDGTWFDMLVNSETENTPAWNEQPAVPVEWWMPPFDPDAAPQPAPGPTPGPTPRPVPVPGEPPDWFARFLLDVERIADACKQLAFVAAKLEADVAAIEEKGLKVRI